MTAITRYTVLREFRQYRTIEGQLSVVQKSSAELQNQEAGIRRKLDEPASTDLLHRVKFVNTLIDQKQLSLADVSARIAGLLPEDAAHLDEFVARYLERGTGALSISAPAGRDASAAISYFAERLASLGVARSRIMVGTHEAASGKEGVEISYMGYVARTDPCGDWTKDLSNTAANQSAPNFGCATQHNIAAMVSDPRDLVQPQPMTDSDATRRGTVLGNYEKGKITAADKSQDQSGKVSGVGSP